MSSSEGPITRTRARDSLDIYRKNAALYPTLPEPPAEDESGVVSPTDSGYAGELLVCDSEEEDEEEEEEDGNMTYEVSCFEDVVEQVKNNIGEFTCLFFLRVFVIIFIAVAMGVGFYDNLFVNPQHLTMEYLIDNQFQDIHYIPLLKIKEIKNNVIAKIDEAEESDPLSIFILTTHVNAKKGIDIAENLVHTFAKFSNKRDTFIQSIYSKLLLLAPNSYNLELTEKLRLGTTAVFIQDFIALPWEKAAVFFKLCDNDNAPYKDRLFVFMSVVEECSSSNPDGEIEALFIKTWSDVADVEAIEALAARVSAISVCICE